MPPGFVADVIAEFPVAAKPLIVGHGPLMTSLLSAAKVGPGQQNNQKNGN